MYSSTWGYKYYLYVRPSSVATFAKSTQGKVNVGSGGSVKSLKSSKRFE